MASPAQSLWTAPNAIYDICMPLARKPRVCNGHDWINYVHSVFPNAAKYSYSYSPILTDLGAGPNQPQCTLPAVSWVVPEGNWSDHGGLDLSGTGPSWSAAMSMRLAATTTTTTSLATNCGDWANTVVLMALAL